MQECRSAGEQQEEEIRSGHEEGRSRIRSTGSGRRRRRRRRRSGGGGGYQEEEQPTAADAALAAPRRGGVPQVWMSKRHPDKHSPFTQDEKDFLALCKAEVPERIPHAWPPSRAPLRRRLASAGGRKTVAAAPELSACADRPAGPHGCLPPAAGPRVAGRPPRAAAVARGRPRRQGKNQPQVLHTSTAKLTDKTCLIICRQLVRPGGGLAAQLGEHTLQRVGGGLCGTLDLGPPDVLPARRRAGSVIQISRSYHIHPQVNLLTAHV